MKASRWPHRKYFVQKYFLHQRVFFYTDSTVVAVLATRWRHVSAMDSGVDVIVRDTTDPNVNEKQLFSY